MALSVAGSTRASRPTTARRKPRPSRWVLVGRLTALAIVMVFPLY
ncbi:hypothetical protein [Curtobacterium sp. B18]|nr:hypothetical protein [Curtobacterium sp. B18]